MGKILIVSAVFPPEPVVSAMLSYDIAMKLYLEGKEVVVVTPRPTRPLNYVFKNEKEFTPFEHIILDSYTCPESKIIGRTRESISFGRAISKFISKYPSKIDVIYANTWALFSQISLAKTARKKGMPYIIHVHDIYPESYCFKLPSLVGKILFRLLIPIDQYVHQNASHILGISPSMIDYLSKTRIVNVCKYRLARNWQDDRNFIDNYRPIEKKGAECHIMYLGSVNPTANIPLVLEAIHNFVSKVHLSIIGNGPDKERCQEIANNTNINVTFDTVKPEEVATKQRDADVLILCLKKGVAKTATPSKLTAYMLSGRPIIASVDLDSDCADIIREARCGFVVEPDDPVALGKAISEMARKTENQLNDMGKAAFEYAKTYLSKKNNLKIIVDTICENINYGL